jgi:hypothetical protein
MSLKYWRVLWRHRSMDTTISKKLCFVCFWEDSKKFCRTERDSEGIQSYFVNQININIEIIAYFAVT